MQQTVKPISEPTVVNKEQPRPEIQMAFQNKYDEYDEPKKFKPAYEKQLKKDQVTEM